MRRRNGARSPLLAALKHSIERAAGDAGFGGFCIAVLPGFVDFLSGKTYVGGGRRNLVPVRNEVSPRARLADFTPRLSGVIFVSQPPLREAFDFERIGLGAIAT